jgi:hypothetical protein
MTSNIAMAAATTSIPEYFADTAADHIEIEVTSAMQLPNTFAKATPGAQYQILTLNRGVSDLCDPRRVVDPC